MPQNAFAPYRQSPNAYGAASPSSSTPTSITPMMVDTGHNINSTVFNMLGRSSSDKFQGQNVLSPMTASSQSQSRQTPRPTANLPYRSPPSGPGQRPPNDMHPPHLPPPNGAYPPTSGIVYQPGPHGTTLPPISSFPELSRQAPSNVSSVRYHAEGSITSPRQHTAKGLHPSPGQRSPKRKTAGSSNVTSSSPSDLEDDDNGELPSKGLLAPWEVLRGLADVAAERAAQVIILYTQHEF